jgi:hypothetical protein
MPKRLTAVLLATSTVALTIGLAAASSSAATTATWSVKPGGSATASGPFQFRDSKTGVISSCKSVKLDVTLKSGKGLAGAGIGSITSVTFTGCELARAFDPLTVAVHGLPWKLNATSYSSNTGVTSATITGIDLVATGPGCLATLDGTAAGADNGMVKITYSNSTGKLKLLPTGGNLHTWAVSGCFGLLKTGDPQQFSGILTVNPKQTITSP